MFLSINELAMAHAGNKWGLISILVGAFPTEDYPPRNTMSLPFSRKSKETFSIALGFFATMMGVADLVMW